MRTNDEMVAAGCLPSEHDPRRCEAAVPNGNRCRGWRSTYSTFCASHLRTIRPPTRFAKTAAATRCWQEFNLALGV